MDKILSILVIGLFAAALHAADSERIFITPPGADPKVAAPFSNGVMVGGTFYVGGHLGVDPATGKTPAAPEAEPRLVLYALKLSFEPARLTLAPPRSVTVYCTDL